MNKKILVLAYQISPTRGSEYSVAWNYVQNMSLDNELVVLYGASGNHMGDVCEIESYKVESPIKNVRFIPVLPNKIAFALNTLNRNGIFVYSFYLAYHIWHRQVFKIAKELIQKEHFDLIHFVGPNGYREPGYLWKLNIPYVWGPIGGTTNVSKILIGALPLMGKIKLGFRAIINSIQLFINTRVKNAIESTDVLMTATTENQNIIKKRYNKESIYIPENGISHNLESLKSLNLVEYPLKLIWIGSLDERKALIILLQAMKRMKNIDNLILHVVGDGYLKKTLTDFATNSKINNRIIWHGAIKRDDVIELLSHSHLHINTSVSEGNPTTLWEAMCVGIPTISLDHCGMHDTICEQCGIKIPIVKYNQVISNLADKLDYLILEPNEVIRLSNGVVECAKKYTWSNRRIFFNNIYELAIINWKKNKSVIL